MPYTAEDCSRLCWPEREDLLDPLDARHEECERELTDFSDPAKEYAYCACECHHKPGLPGYREHTAGRGMDRHQVSVWRYESRPGPLQGYRGVCSHLDP